MQYEPLDIEAFPYDQKKKKEKQQKSLDQKGNAVQQKNQQVQQLVYINTLSFQAMEADISLPEYLTIFFGCAIAIYLFTKLMPILTLENCGEVGFRIIGLISLFYFVLPPLSLCSTGFKNNKKLCSFVSKLFFVISIINLISVVYVFSVSSRVSKAEWYLLKSSCNASEETETEFKTTQIILCQIFLSINGFVIFALMRNLAKLIEIRDCAVRKKMVILPHKIINVNFPVFYDQMNFFFHKMQVPAFWTCFLF